MDCSLPGSSVHGIFQARLLERAATSFSSSCIVCMNNCVFVFSQAQKLKSNISGSTHLCLSDVSCFFLSLPESRNRAFGSLEQGMMWKDSKTTRFQAQKKIRVSLGVPLPLEPGADPGVPSKRQVWDPHPRTGPAQIPLSRYHENLCDHSYISSAGIEKIHNTSCCLPDVP